MDTRGPAPIPMTILFRSNTLRNIIAQGELGLGASSSQTLHSVYKKHVGLLDTTVRSCTHSSLQNLRHSL